MEVKRMTYIVLVLSWLLWLASCKDENKSVVYDEDAQYALGFKILEGQCVNCHSFNPENTKLAPSMSQVKMAYLDAYKDNELFKEKLSSFLRFPTPQKTVMTEAVRKYGVMPKYNLNPQELSAVVTYIQGSQLERKNWFQDIYPSEKDRLLSQAKIKEKPIDLGKKYAMTTKVVLGKNLLGAIQQRGSAGAVDFCNTRALSLTDSMAVHQGVSIKRVSDKPRNPQNQASDLELAYISAAKNQLAKGEDVSPKLTTDNDGTHVGYYPIVTNDMCLQCHGKKDIQIKSDTWDVLQEKYPQDLAIGYSSKELRGIWVVEWKE